MGILLILLSLAAAGVVADFLAQNDLSTASSQPLDLLGGTFHLSTPELVLGGAVLGAIAVLFIVLGLGIVRGSWGRRRALKRRVVDLESENTQLRSKVHLSAAVGDDREGSDSSASGRS